MKIFIFPVESQGQKRIVIRTEQFDPACNALIKKIPGVIGIQGPKAGAYLMRKRPGGGARNHWAASSQG